MDFPSVTLRAKEEGRLQAGHLWAFSNEIAEAPPDMEPGALADLYDARGGFLARGFYHPNSLIAFRVLTPQKDDIAEQFFEKRLLAAKALRDSLFPGRKNYRWVFGESDRLPGLVVDRYGDYAVIQIFSAGMERFRDLISSILQRQAQLKGIIARPDVALRGLEGLEQGEPTVLYGEVPERVVIDTDSGQFEVDLRGGQKTGFFFDQQENRKALAPFCNGKRVLDGFCYVGGFGIAAGLAGASQITFADMSEPALTLAKANAERNGLAEKSVFVKDDVATLFARSSGADPFDVISIDPPAFARSKKHLTPALKGYEKLNSAAMSAVRKGGILASSSCSHHVGRDLFIEMLRRSARKANRTVRILEIRSQAKDHPILLSMPETEYLKFVIMQVG
jgi:23S rRNA (cytosine1962-C5)-methyltransferase